MSQEIVFRSNMLVSLIRQNGRDLDVARSAWVSTQGEDARDQDSTKVAGLINFLLRERHGSTFEHNTFTFFVKTPIFVAREFMRHRIASFNEESGRYAVLKPEFYVPDAERKLVQTGKPGAYHFVEGTDFQFQTMRAATRVSSEYSYRAYETMLEAGVAKEVARMVLPVNIYTSFYCTMNARALMHFLGLRTEHEDATFPSHPQLEIQMVADQMEAYFAEAMPITHAAWVKAGRVAP